MTGKRRPKQSLEEDIEFSNVTKFRNSLLGAVERVQSHPAKRYVITKHGEPEAVLMSYQTYSVLSKVMDQALDGIDAPSREEAIRAAFERLRNDSRPTAFDQEAVAILAEPSPETLAEVTFRRSGRNATTNRVREILRRHFIELDNTLKSQDEEDQGPGASVFGEKQ